MDILTERFAISGMLITIASLAFVQFGLDPSSAVHIVAAGIGTTVGAGLLVAAAIGFVIEAIADSDA